MDNHEFSRRSAAEQGGPFSLGGEAEIGADAAAALAALLDRRLGTLGADCANDELIDAAMIEAMTIVPGTADQVRRRLLSVAPHRPDAEPSRKRKRRRR